MRRSKFRIEASELSNDILIKNIEFGFEHIKRGRIAIKAAIEMKNTFVSEGYIEEKLSSLVHIQKWMIHYFEEIKERYKAGKLSDDIVQRYEKARENSFL